MARRSDFTGFAGFDHFVEVDEERVGVVRAGGGFGVILDREDGEFGVAEAFDGAVVEVELGDFGAAFFEGLRVGGEAVVLRGDGDFAGLQIFHGLVAAAVAELELEGGAAHGVREHLVAEADAEDGVLVEEAGHRFMDIGEGGGIAGAVREEDGVGVVLFDLFGGVGGRENLHIEAVADEFAEDGVLGAEVEGGHAELFRGDAGGVHRGADGEVGRVVVGHIVAAPQIRLFDGDFFDVVGAGHVLPVAGLGDGVGVGDGEGAEAALHGAIDAEFFGEGAGIDFAEAGDAVFFEIGVERGLAAPVADDRGEFADDEAGAFGGVGLGVFVVDAVVADLRRGHGDDLAEVGGIGDDLLVAGHRGVEDTLACDGGVGSEREAAENGTVFEGENSLLGRGH